MRAKLRVTRSTAPESGVGRHSLVDLQDDGESDRECVESCPAPPQPASCSPSAPVEIDLTQLPESDGEESGVHRALQTGVDAARDDNDDGDDEDDDEVQVVGWTAPRESSDPVKLEPSKRRRVADPSGVDSTAVTLGNYEALERFRAALRCSICLERILKMTATHCGHVFCGPCIRAQIRVNRKCPLCQRCLQTTEVHPLFF